MTDATSMVTTAKTGGGVLFSIYNTSILPWCEMWILDWWPGTQAVRASLWAELQSHMRRILLLQIFVSCFFFVLLVSHHLKYHQCQQQEPHQCHQHHSSCKPELSWTCSFPAERFLNKDEYFQSLHEILKLYMRPSIPTQQATMAYPPKTKVMPHFRGRKSDFEPDPRPGHSYRIYFLF